MSYLGNSPATSTEVAKVGAIYEGVTTIQQDYNIRVGYNAMTPGPITIATGFVVTVPPGSRWTIV